MKKRIAIALLLLLLAALGCAAELCDWLLPTISWPFTVSRERCMFSAPGDWCPPLAVDGRFHWFGSNTVASGRGDQYAGGASMFYLKR